MTWTRGGEKQVELDQGGPCRPRARHASRKRRTCTASSQATAVTLSVKAGAAGRLFGSVKTSDIADAVAAAGLGAIDKRKIEITTPIKATGRHEATVRLRDELLATITIQVVAAR